MYHSHVYHNNTFSICSTKTRTTLKTIRAILSQAQPTTQAKIGRQFIDLTSSSRTLTSQSRCTFTYSPHTQTCVGHGGFGHSQTTLNTLFTFFLEIMKLYCLFNKTVTHIDSVVKMSSELFMLRTFLTIQKRCHAVLITIKRLWLLKLMKFENLINFTNCSCS